MIEWRGKQLLAKVEKASDKKMRKAAKRVYLVAKVKAPVGRTTYTYSGGDTWKHRTPGSLKKSMRWRKSKFRGGGYIVAVGDYNVFYPRFVELGIPKSPGATYRSGPKKGDPIPRIKGKHFLKQGLDAGDRLLKRELRKLI